MANSCGDHLNTMINNLLEYSKLKAKKIELNQTPIDIIENVRSVLKMNYFKAKENGNQLTLWVSESFPKKVLGDEMRIKQIVINLISNAIKFTSNGTVKISVGFKYNYQRKLRKASDISGGNINYEEDKALFSILENEKQGNAGGLENQNSGLSSMKDSGSKCSGTKNEAQLSYTRYMM